MGNCTVTVKKKSPVSPSGKTVIVDIALSSSYATGGDTVTLASLGLKRLSALMLQTGVSSPGGHALEVINGADEYTAPKIRARDVAAGTELANAGDRSAEKVRAIAYSMPYR